ncbi:MAG: hypothetical protein K5705_06240 [Oscillospiraceae bacterium]|nr:hypothetical protein [Oscillospiraceae bacterium]
MATVTVSSWTEFLQAIQISGDDVHCPENAVWDMNENAPDGFIGTIRFDCANVYGHNCTIKNLKYDGNINFHSGFGIMSDLHWENIIANSGNQQTFFNRANSDVSSPTGLSQMVLCRISGYFTFNGSRYPCDPIGGFVLYRCGINIESPAGTFNMPAKMQYTNFIAQLPNASTIHAYAGQGRPGFGHYFSNVITVAPNCVNDYSTAYADGCVFRGRKERLGGFGAACGGTYMSLYCTTDMDAITNPNGVVGVTETQLKDAAYLQSIGFPIGV